VQEPSPEAASAPWKAMSSGWLYHPLASAARAGAAVTLGAVPSYWRFSVTPFETFPALSVQRPVTDAEPESGPE
jgi:hypothetical protein